VKELTEGSSLKANLELVYNNAILAARIAKSYSQLVKQNP
jgi:pseudouridine-5'-phosphate glycosidase